MTDRPPLPPFTRETAAQKVQAAEDAWNTRDPHKVALAYSLRKDLWAYDGNRIAVRFQYECRDAGGQWWRSYGNELWEFDAHGLMTRREASIDDVPIEEKDRRIHGPRPESERGLSFPLQ